MNEKLPTDKMELVKHVLIRLKFRGDKQEIVLPFQKGDAAVFMDADGGTFDPVNEDLQPYDLPRPVSNLCYYIKSQQKCGYVDMTDVAVWEAEFRMAPSSEALAAMAKAKMQNRLRKPEEV